MSLKQEIQELIQQEESTLENVVGSLKKQLADSFHKFSLENTKAREMTVQLTTASRDEDKQQLSSDEAVSHQLAKQKKDEVNSIEQLIDRPYFARISLQEGERTIDYKLGIQSNLDCRIIDWRNAPIAKIFYEYQEGEEYEEIIQGRERFGKVTLKNKFEISKQELKSINCSHGRYVKGKEGWKQDSAGANYGKGGLKPILNLITPEQFSLITEDSGSAVLLQGVAGSGKTTVALHRLAWLLHEDNSEASAESALVLVASESLRRYLGKTMPKLGIQGISIFTFSEWARALIARNVGRPVESLLVKNPPIWASRVKRSRGIIEALKKNSETITGKGLEAYKNCLLKTLRNHHLIIEKDETKLLDKEVIERTLSWTETCFEQDRIDSCDLGLYLLLKHHKDSSFFKNNAAVTYMVVDEIQDLSPAELEVVLNIVDKKSNLTLVGDTAQKITVGDTFSGWDAIRKTLKSSEAEHNFTTLDMSHRSTLPIMRLADHILGESRTTKGRPGKKPIWFLCKKEDSGIVEAVSWLTRVLDKYPGKATCVICPNLEQAKYARSLLEPTFGNTINFCEDNDFTYEEGITVTHVSAAKGLEFSNVLVWNPIRQYYPNEDIGRNSLYTAITRAAELICIVTWGRFSNLLPRPTSNLVRVHRIDEDDHKPKRPQKLFD